MSCRINGMTMILQTFWCIIIRQSVAIPERLLNFHEDSSDGKKRLTFGCAPFGGIAPILFWDQSRPSDPNLKARVHWRPLHHIRARETRCRALRAKFERYFRSVGKSTSSRRLSDAAPTIYCHYYDYYYILNFLWGLDCLNYLFAPHCKGSLMEVNEVHWKLLNKLFRKLCTWVWEFYSKLCIFHENCRQFLTKV